MDLAYFTERPESQPVQDLIQFDLDSIRQFVAGQRDPMPDVWLVVPDGYEKSGRVLRDSETSRLLAYSTKNRALYATDGCNTCARRLPKNLEELSTENLKTFAEANELRVDVVERLAKLLRETVSGLS